MTKVLRALILCLMIPSLALGEDEIFKRQVEFEWEAIQGAKAYDIELKSVKDPNQIISFQSPSPSFVGTLEPGKYLLRLRSRDHRNVPGTWSPSSDFNVGLDPVVAKLPLKNQILSTDDLEKTALTLSWEKVPGATSYQLSLTSKDGAVKIDKTLDTNSFKTDLPVAQEFTWSVQALSKEGFSSDTITTNNFTVLAKKIETPQITPVESEYVRDLKWSRPPNVKNFEVTVHRLGSNRRLENVLHLENTELDSIPFEKDWKGGAYRLTVKAKGTLRPDSEIQKMSFKVKEGDRSSFAENNALVKRSISRIDGWYGIAGYLITETVFSSINYDRQSESHYDVLGGTGMFGVGRLSPKSPWGFLSTIEISGYSANDKITTFGAAEVNVIYRFNLSDRSELHLQGGISYKELPITIVDSTNDTIEESMVNSAGPHLGVEYRFAFTSKFGFQANVHLYPSVIKLDTPNGEDLKTSVNSQLGISASYRLTPGLTGLLGFMMREDEIKYGARPPTNAFITGQSNEAKIKRNYLTFIIEWAF